MVKESEDEHIYSCNESKFLQEFSNFLEMLETNQGANKEKKDMEKTLNCYVISFFQEGVTMTEL